jgi:hypothetical protein
MERYSNVACDRRTGAEGLRVEIRRFVDDNFPGWVECAFTDAHGREWVFVEKVPVVSMEDLEDTSSYPRPCIIACEVIARHEGDVVVVDIARPWGLEATTGQTRFEVRSDQLAELYPEA